MTKILVTGSSGLIGAALVRRLRQERIAVTGLDRRPAGTTDVVDCLGGGAITADLIAPFSGVVHLAGVSRVVWGQRDPRDCWYQNVGNTAALIEATRSMAIPPWIVYASSREVFGQAEALPVRDDAPVAPINVYGCSKAASEMLLQQAIARGLRGAVVRFSTVYGGVDDHPDRVVPAFMRATMANRPITIFGEDVALDPTWIDDAIDGVWRLILALNENRVPERPILFSGGSLVRLVDMAETIRRTLKTENDIVVAPPRTYDVERFAGVPSYAAEFLGWTPTTSFASGIDLYAARLGARVAA